MTLALFSLCLFGSSRLAAQGEPATNAPPRPGRETLPHRPSPVASPAHVTATARLIPWSHLVFQTFRNDNWEIYSSNDDASDQLRLTVSGESDIHPVYNRGATRIAYARKDGDYEIRVMNSDGSGNVALTDNGTDDVFPAWSPDGAWLAFQAYRDGQAEIYRMRADGTGAQRLTTSADYDGEPAWSPDGSKIAFVARRQGQYRIWVMNADGSGQTQLSYQSYSSNPAWSPDGLRLAYDADGDGDGWQELWVMHADGSNQQMVYRPGGMNTDAWAGSWSPDGRFLAFTNINFILHDGNWYWTTARLLALDPQSGQLFHLGATDVDWNPDWQTYDTAAPTSGVRALPAESPATFNVAWFGSDVGPAGLKNFDVQIKTGAGGAWTGWLTQTTQTSGTFIGIGGQSYFIRARARDWANNVEAWPADYDAATTIEALPPISTVQPLPTFARAPFLVQWSGVDPGSSGVAHFDVQSRTGSTGSWQDWQVRTYATSAEFNGASGQTYYFRARATDWAQNVEAWPDEADAGPVTFYDWALTGIVRDNAGAPIGAANTVLTPAALTAPPSDRMGGFNVYAVAASGPYTATWAKPGYGSPPQTGFPTSQDGQLNVYLPPSDNVIRNPDFESELSNWTVSGQDAPIVRQGSKHTGVNGVLFGNPDQLFEPAVNFGSTGPYGSAVTLQAGSNGQIHALWFSGASLLYAKREGAGLWSTPETVPMVNGLYLSAVGATLKADSTGGAHIVYKGGLASAFDYYHVYRSPTGIWSTPYNFTNTATSVGLTGIVADSQGRLIIVWSDDVYSFKGAPRLLQRIRQPNGDWSSTLVLVTAKGSRLQESSVAIDASDRLHLLWLEETHIYGESQLYYARQLAGSLPTHVHALAETQYAYNPQLRVSPDGQAHVTYVDRRLTGWIVAYQSLDAGGAHGPLQHFTANRVFAMELDKQGKVHLVISGSGSGPCARSCYLNNVSGAWSAPELLGFLEPAALAVNDHGGVSVIWFSGDRFMWKQRGLDGGWSEPLVVSAPFVPPINFSFSVVVSDNGAINLLYSTPNGPNFQSSRLATQTINSALSQLVTVPSTSVTPWLSFVNRLYGASPHSGAGLVVLVTDSQGVTTALNRTTDNGHWQQSGVSLSPWAGQTVTVTIATRQAPGTPYAWAEIDEVTLGSSYPDVWVTVPSRTARRGEEVRYVIRYGNQGGAPASDVQLSFTLPAEVSFVSVNVPPTTTGTTLTWNLGNLPAKTGPYEIVVTGRISSTVPIPSTFNHSAQIQCTTSELETLNNTESVTTTVEPFFVRLPLILR
jgi:uncharacterized repeat protein (TIGR01451 family)